MADDFQVVVAGLICLDIIPTFTSGVELPPPGQISRVGPAVVATGGAVSNTGRVLQLLGVETRLMGKIGDDPLGQTLLNLIRAHHPPLADGIIVAPGEATSYTIVLNPPGLDRSFVHCPGANDTFCQADLNLDIIARSRLFHLGYPPLLTRLYADGGRELVEIFRTVHDLGVTTSLDMVVFEPHGPAAQADWPAILRATLPHVDLFMPGIEELLLALRPAEYDQLSARGDILDRVTPGFLRELADILIGWGTRIVAFKLGTRGMYLRTAGSAQLAGMGAARPADVRAWADRELWAPIFKVSHFGGTTGAGDAAIAGFITSLLAGCRPEEALTFACAVGACCVEAPDALGGIQSRDKTQARIASGWPRVPLSLDAPGWRFDPVHQLWIGK